MPAGLNIAALAQRTGVAPDTLRKWEQRYAILQPSRTPGGQRRYSERDVQRVEWLRERLEEGYRIGEAASLLGSAVEPARSKEDQLRGILASLESGDTAEIGIRLDQAFALNGLEDTLDGIVRPLLETVGNRWAGGELTVAEEHLVSEAVRSRLGHLLADTGGGVRGVAVLACAPGERHELGLMMATIALRRDGWKVFYLGSDTPVEDAVELARRVSAQMLGWSISDARLGEALAPVEEVALVVGGRGATPELAERLRATHVGVGLSAVAGALRKLSV
jgi:DNA-binding transcriptional MerR regulator/methylmalonyl-CoA mutase cobalamin-binding subunit